MSDYKEASKKMINGVSIGDVFTFNKVHHKAIVVDILEQRSLADGTIKGHVCIAKPIDGLATNEFPIPFSTVVRNRVLTKSGG